MTATANLSALRAAALGGEPLACLALADLALEAGDDARADAWRWLANPPAQGWERRAADLMGLAGAIGVEANGAWVEGRGPHARDRGPLTSPARLWHRRVSAGPAYLWDENRGWRIEWANAAPVDYVCPDAVREDVLAACRLAVGR
jgi:hypothetical protein